MSAGINPVIALSDERDQWERRIEQAYRDGQRAAEIAHEDDYTHGYLDGALGRKHVQHDVYEMAKIDVARWGPFGREHFADPRPGDYPGGSAGLALTTAAWAAEGLDLGPGPGWVHLGGTAVHHHRCEPVCYQHSPGWYTLADAIGILERLPGDYDRTVADLRAKLADLDEGTVAA